MTPTPEDGGPAAIEPPSPAETRAGVSVVATAAATVAAAVLATPPRSGPPPAPTSSSATPPSSRPSSSSSSSVTDAETLSRAANGEAGADPGVQARPFEKAPPAPRLEVVEKGIGTLSGADKAESSSAKTNHAPAALAGVLASSPTGVAHRPAFLDGAPPPAPRPAAHHAAQAGATSPVRAELAGSLRHLEGAPPARANGASASNSSDETAPPFAAPPATHPMPPLPLPLDAAAVTAPAPPPPPFVPDVLLAYATEDASLRANVTPERATLSVDTGAAGELSLHLRVKDGVTDVHVSGEAAASLDVRPQDLRTALAGEGLTLGSFESGQSPPRQTDVDPRDEPAAPRDSRPTGAPVDGAGDTQTSSPPRNASRGVHVTA